jgi:hypothetical protein
MSDKDLLSRHTARLAVSRRAFMRGAASGGGAALALQSASVTSATAARDDEDEDHRVHGLCDDPFPIPHLTTLPFGSVHFFFPGPVEGTSVPSDPTGAHDGRDPSLITDFRGFIGQAELNLSGTGTNAVGDHAPYTFHTDMRFMKGTFIATDGQHHRGAFAFI